MKQLTERRLVPFTEFEVRATGGDGPPELVGYAAVFNQEQQIDDWFSSWLEEVAPGAFKKTIREGDIRALWNHDPSIVLGRNKAGTLELREDEHGLHTVIRPPDNEWGRPVIDAIRRGDVSGMSISFQVIKQQMEYPPKGTEGKAKRTIKEARLMDVSPVTFPAFPQTEIAARAEEGRDGALPLQDDELLRAGALARRAQMGLVLSAEDRSAIAEAVSILESVARESGGDRSIADIHSPEAAEAEPGAGYSACGSDLGRSERAGAEDGAHSAEARARRLRLIRMQVKTTQES